MHGIESMFNICDLLQFAFRLPFLSFTCTYNKFILYFLRRSAVIDSFWDEKINVKGNKYTTIEMVLF